MKKGIKEETLGVSSEARWPTQVLPLFRGCKVGCNPCLDLVVPKGIPSERNSSCHCHESGVTTSRMFIPWDCRIVGSIYLIPPLMQNIFKSSASGLSLGSRRLAITLAPGWVGRPWEKSLDWEVLSIVFSTTAPALCALNTERREEDCVSPENCQFIDFLTIPLPLPQLRPWINLHRRARG